MAREKEVDDGFRLEFEEKVIQKTKLGINLLRGHVRFLHLLGYTNETGIKLTPSGAPILDRRYCNSFTIAFDKQLTSDTDHKQGVALLIHYAAYDYFKSVIEYMGEAYLEETKKQSYLVISFRGDDTIGASLSKKRLAIPIENKITFDRIKKYSTLYVGRAKNKNGAIAMLNILPDPIRIVSLNVRNNRERRGFMS